MVCSRDTDVLLLLVSHYPQMQCNNLWVISGTSKKREFIPVGPVFNSVQRDLTIKLLSFHALTGCDTTSYLANHSKKSSWKVFREHHSLLNNLGVGELSEETMQSAEKFVCRIYNVHQTDSVDVARHILFSKGGKPELLPPDACSLSNNGLEKCSHVFCTTPKSSKYGMATKRSSSQTSFDDS